MRISLTLIASFFFFFKSFASGNIIVGYVWFNNNAGPSDCDLVDAGIVDEAVDEALEEAGITEARSWAIGSSSYSHGRSLRGDGRELVCSSWCINRCKSTPYMCYGVCTGCMTRNLESNDDVEENNDDGEESIDDGEESIDDAKESFDDAEEYQPYKSISLLLSDSISSLYTNVLSLDPR
jgi:hypothetical protein